MQERERGHQSGHGQAGIEVALARHPFFADLGAALLQPLAGCAAAVRFAPGEQVCREGEAADRFYLIRAGLASIEIATAGRGRQALQTVADGDVVGWSWLIPPYRWHFDVRAVEAVQAIGLDGACLRAACAAHRELGYQVVTRLCGIMVQRLEATRLQLLDVYGTRA